jgi:DNA-binding CsgD family transcriptional regulator
MLFNKYIGNKTMPAPACFLSLQGHMKLNKRLLLYGVLLAVFTISLKLLEYKLVILNHSLELYGLVLAVIFTLIGIWAGKKLTGTKEVLVEKTIYVAAPSKDFTVNEGAIEQLGISKREYEILELMAQGMSNQEIADKLFISVSTIKTHTSNLFMKLDVNRRALAVKKAKELNLIP